MAHYRKNRTNLEGQPEDDMFSGMLPAVNLLQSWIDDEDESEQQETGQYLIHALDEDRLSDRKLFPLEMKGITR